MENPNAPSASKNTHDKFVVRIKNETLTKLGVLVGTACVMAVCVMAAPSSTDNKDVLRLMEQQNKELKRIADTLEVIAGKRP